MIGDLSALECLKDFGMLLVGLMARMDQGEKLEPNDINIQLLLRARECLAAARTEEHYVDEKDTTLELPDQDISKLTSKPDYGYLEKQEWIRVEKKDKD